MAGQGTVSVEILEQLQEEEQRRAADIKQLPADENAAELVVYVPVGGGGLIGGMAAVRGCD